MPRRLYYIFFIVLLVFPVTACEELFVDKKNAHFAAYYHPPQQDPIFLGEVKGIKSCRIAVAARAKMMKKPRRQDDYVCCYIKGASDCKIRMY